MVEAIISIDTLPKHNNLIRQKCVPLYEIIERMTLRMSQNRLNGKHIPISIL